MAGKKNIKDILTQNDQSKQTEKPADINENIESSKKKRSKKEVDVKEISMFKKILMRIIWVLFFLILAGSFTAGIFFSLRFFQNEKIKSVSALVSSELLQCAELTVVKNNYSEIATVKKTGVLGMAKSYAIIKYTGVIRAGVDDISKASFKISEDVASITVSIPKAVIVGNDISKFEVFDEFQNIFVPISLQEVFNVIDTARITRVDTLVRDGILQDAEAHIKNLLERVLSAMRFSSITVEFI